MLLVHKNCVIKEYTVKPSVSEYGVSWPPGMDAFWHRHWRTRITTRYHILLRITQGPIYKISCDYRKVDLR